MTPELSLRDICVAALLCVAGTAQAQLRFPLPSAAEIQEEKTYDPPVIGAAYAMRLAAQPDMQGQWIRKGDGFDPSGYKEAFAMATGTTFSASAGSRIRSIPLKPEYEKQYQEVIADAMAGKDRDTFALCKPYGMPRFMHSPAGFDLMQGPEMIVLHDAYDRETRRIFLDGRPHPPALGDADSDARTYTGHSTGHWEGKTLVVDTVNIVAGVYDNTLAPHSDQIHVTERFKLAGPHLLHVTMIIEDPVMLTKPWVVEKYYHRILQSALQNQPGTYQSARDRRYKFHNLIDSPCAVNIDMSQGYQSLILPQEEEAQQEQQSSEATPAKKKAPKAKSKAK